MSAPLPLTIVGASGLLVGEALRLLEGHPAIAVREVVSRTPGQRLEAFHPHLAGTRLGALETVDLAPATRTLAERLAHGNAACLLGLPHGESASAWCALRSELGDAAERLTLVDLSADHRLDPARYARWYAAHPDPGELAHFRYALPELASEPLRGATRLAAPGCFATALQLACVPAAEAGWLEPERTWTLSAVTGSSGSGAHPKAGTHHPHRAGNLWAYALDGHRHEAELVQALGFAPPLVFVPHSGPFVRGIHLTAVLPLVRDVGVEEARARYAARFEGRPFVHVLEGEVVPDLRRVAGSNRAAIAVHRRADALVVLVTLDNLVKGGVGQALQALNLALDLPEDLGLSASGLGVV